MGDVCIGLILEGMFVNLIVNVNLDVDFKEFKDVFIKIFDVMVEIKLYEFDLSWDEVDLRCVF